MMWQNLSLACKALARKEMLPAFAFSLDHVRQPSERRVPRRAGTSVSFEQLQNPYHRSFLEFSCPVVIIIARSTEVYIELVVEALLSVFLSLAGGLTGEDTPAP
jgi:hypothetical protein